ncbi:unnamed protein product, partial [marine sediment metagenome]
AEESRPGLGGIAEASKVIFNPESFGAWNLGFVI